MARQLMFSIRQVGRKGIDGQVAQGQAKPTSTRQGRAGKRSCARTCTRAYTRIYTHMRAHAGTRAMRAHTHTHAPAHAHVRTHTHTHTPVWGRTRSIELTHTAENVTPLDISTLNSNATEHIARNEPRMPRIDESIPARTMCHKEYNRRSQGILARFQSMTYLTGLPVE